MNEIRSFARVTNIERAMNVLETLSEHPHGSTVGELARQLSLPVSAASRILGTLEAEGYVARDPLSGRFSISLKLLALVLKHAERLGLDDLCLPLLRPVAEETGELVQMALVDGDDLRFVLKAESPNRVRTVALMGTNADLHATAAGKAWLANLSRNAALALALNKGMAPRTDKTVTSVDALGQELDLTSERGYATNIGEHTLGVNSVAVAIRAPRKNMAVIGTVGISGPDFRLTEEKIKEYAPRLTMIAAELGIILPSDLVSHY